MALASTNETHSSQASCPAGLRVCVDARATLRQGGTGVATYGAVLIRTLEQIGARAEVVTDGRIASPGLCSLGRRWVGAVDGSERRLRSGVDSAGRPCWIGGDIFRKAQVHFNLYGALLKVSCENPPAIMHWTYPLPIRMVRTINIYTIHDAIPWDRPDLTRISRRRFRRLLKQVTAAADHIVTVSDHSRDALLRLLALDPAKITNTYQAAPLNLAQDEPLPLGLQPGGYLLFCGSVEPRKNLGRLVAAHSRSGVNLPLVIIGPDGWRAKGELPKGMDEKIIRAPWLERAALDSLMRQAKALLFPSLAEGFGLPVLEAMVVGTPVMTSSQGALAEIANDAALTIDPYDIDAMADAIASLVYDTRLLARLSAAGLARSVAFSQAAYGARLTKVYSAVTAASPSTT